MWYTSVVNHNGFSKLHNQASHAQVWFQNVSLTEKYGTPRTQNYTHRCWTFFDGFLGIFNLKEMAIRRENCNCSVVSRRHSCRFTVWAKIKVFAEKFWGIKKWVLGSGCRIAGQSQRIFVYEVNNQRQGRIQRWEDAPPFCHKSTTRYTFMFCLRCLKVTFTISTPLGRPTRGLLKILDPPLSIV